MSRALEWFHFGRAVAWATFGGWVLAFEPTLRQSLTVLFILSIAACVESALGAWSSRRAERRTAESGRTFSSGPQD